MRGISPNSTVGYNFCDCSVSSSRFMAYREKIAQNKFQRVVQSFCIVDFWIIFNPCLPEGYQ